MPRAMALVLAVFLSTAGVAVSIDAPHFAAEHGTMHPFVFMGEAVDFGTYPWFATLFIEVKGGYGTYICGSVLANSKYVLTAAHCVENSEFITILFNDVFNPNKVWYPHPNRYARYAHVHPLYDAATLNYDIAVIELNSEVADINFPRLALDEREWLAILAGGMLTVVGHGLTENGTLDWHLRRVDLPKVPNTSCIGSSSNMWHSSQVHNDLCAGLTTGCLAKACPDACSGDSGGPLFDAGRHVVYGLVSRGEFPCGLANRPGIFTNLAFYKSFIQYYVSPAATLGNSTNNSTYIVPLANETDKPPMYTGSSASSRAAPGWVTLVSVGFVVHILYRYN